MCLRTLPGRSSAAIAFRAIDVVREFRARTGPATPAVQPGKRGHRDAGREWGDPEQLRERGYVHATYSSKIVNRSSSNVVQRLQHICDGAKSHADATSML